MQFTSKQKGQFGLITARVVGRRVTSLTVATSSPLSVSSRCPDSSSPGLNGSTRCGVMLSRERFGLPGRRLGVDGSLGVDGFSHGPNSLRGALGLSFFASLIESL